jgi:nucleotide-binding universal stress UspA family protein
MNIIARRIVCPTDFSDASLIALSYAAMCGLRSAATLWVVHVVKPLPYDGASVPAETAMQNLHVWHSALRKLTGESIAIVPTVREGDVADEIGCLAREVKADLLIMATHERTMWERYRDGSITDEVASQVDCPVVSITVGPQHEVLRTAHGRSLDHPLCLN